MFNPFISMPISAYGSPVSIYNNLFNSAVNTTATKNSNKGLTYAEWQSKYGSNSSGKGTTTSTTKKSKDLGSELARGGDKGTLGDGGPLGSSLGGTSTKGNEANAIRSSINDQQVNAVAKDSLMGVGREAMKGTLGTATVGALAGMPASDIASMSMQAGLAGVPTGLAGTVGNIAAQHMGIEPNAFSSVVGGLLGSTLGPIGGIVGAVAAPTIGGLVADAMDMRSMEAVRDAMEDTLGGINGRRVGSAFASEYDKTKTLGTAFNNTINSLNVSDLAKQEAKSSFANALGDVASRQARDKLGQTADEIKAAAPAAYATAMMGLSDLSPDGMVKGAFDDMSTISAPQQSLTGFSAPASSVPNNLAGTPDLSQTVNQQVAQAAAAATTQNYSQSLKDYDKSLDAITDSFSTPNQQQQVADTLADGATDLSLGFGDVQDATSNAVGKGAEAASDNDNGGGYGSDPGGFGTGVGGDIGGGAMSHGPSQDNFGGIGGYGNLGGDESGW